MSSRIHRPEEAADAVAFAWRRLEAADPSAAPGGSENSGASQHRVREQQHQEAQRDSEARLEAARRQALAEGEAAGAKKAAHKPDPAIAAFHSMTEQLARQAEVRRAEVEEDLVKLAIAIARRVLHRELSTDPEA